MTANTKAELEIERKYFFENEDVLKETLERQGFAFSGKGQETDIYFSDGDGEYIRNRTCLRFRTKDGRQSLSVDYKGKSESLTGGFAKRETNIIQPLGNIGAMEELLTHLGFYRYVDVVKTRETFRRNGDDFIENIVFDRLEGVGNFLEIELIAPVGHGSLPSLQQALKKREEGLLSCGLRPADVPYRDFAAWAYRKKFGVAPFETILIDLDRIFGFSSNSLQTTAFHEATGDAATVAGIKALREMAKRYRLILVTSLKPDALAGWLQKSEVPQERVYFVTTIEEAYVKAGTARSLAMLGQSSACAENRPCLKIGENPFHHLMQAHLILAHAEPCEVV